MNSSSTDPSELSPALVALRTTFIICIGVLIVAGNLLSITVTRSVTDLAESTKVLMITLAVSDLLIGSSTVVYVVASAMDRWPFGYISCQLTVVVTMTNFFVSVFSAVLLNLERYIAVTRPFKFPIWCTRHRVTGLVLVFWALCLFTTIYMQFIVGLPAEYMATSAVCFLNLTVGYGGIITLILLNLLPVFVITLVYLRLIRISQEHNRRIDPGSQNRKLYDNPALKAFLAVALTFAGCTTPVFVYKNVEYLAGVTFPGWLEFVAVWLGISNSALNVLIYCLFKQSYRRRAREILSKQLLCCCRHSVQPLDI